MTLPLHGGDLAAAEARWGRPSGGWLDLSTGVNPWPYPLPPLADSVWHRLPGAAEEGVLRRAAAHRYRLPGADFVLPAPGSGALIQALPRLYPPGPVAVVGPTYGEHARAWAAAGHEVRRVESISAAAGAAVVVVVNPNNPDGRLLAPEAVAATDCSLLVVDEAFGDVVPEASVVPLLCPGMVVLRSFGKFYGLAGLRLGFALGLPAQLAAVATALGPWAVSGPALAVGTTALADDGWAVATRAHLAAMAARLDAVLGEAGLTVVGGTSLFRLARHPEAAAIWNRLGRAGILVRSFAERPTLLRFGLPGSEAEMARLAQSLSP